MGDDIDEGLWYHILGNYPHERLVIDCVEFFDEVNK